MPTARDAAEDLKRVKRELCECKRELTEVKTLNDRLRRTIGGEGLQGWTPQKQIERQYGWVFAWLYPLNSYLNQNLNQPLTPEIRNRASDICAAIIAQLAVMGKYGIELPFDPRPESARAEFLEKQERISDTGYVPCMICGEDRITHDCHTIPRSDGGFDHPSNFVTLCPLHHHLFDHHRLRRDEWNRLMPFMEGKAESAIVYAREVRAPQLERLWNKNANALKAGQLVKCVNCGRWVGQKTPHFLTPEDEVFCIQCAGTDPKAQDGDDDDAQETKGSSCCQFV